MQVVLEEGLKDGYVLGLTLDLSVNMVDFDKVKVATEGVLNRKELVVIATQKGASCPFVNLIVQLILLLARQLFI